MKILKTREDIRLFNYATKLWGNSAQIWQAIEEMGELLTALNKFNRNKVNRYAVIDEIADVTIMMAQLSNIFGSRDVNRVINKKMLRLRERIDKQLVENMEKHFK